MSTTKKKIGRFSPPRGRPFVKGQVTNPLGAGAHNQDLKALRRLTHDEIALLGTLVVNGNVKELERIKNDPESSALKIWFMAVVMKSIQKGDMQALNGFLDRVVGRVSNEVKVVSHNTTNLSVVDQQKLAEAIAQLEHDV